MGKMLLELVHEKITTITGAGEEQRMVPCEPVIEGNGLVREDGLRNDELN